MKIICIIVFMVVVLAMIHKNHGMGSMYNGILVGGLVYYGLVPLLNEINKDSITIKNNYYINMGTGKYIAVYFMIIVFFFFIFISNNGHFNKKNYLTVPNEKKFNNNLELFGFFCLIFGGCSLLLFFGALGGVSQALAIAEMARSFTSSLTDYMPYYASLLIIPARLVMVAPYCFWSLIYLNKRRKMKYKILMILSFVLAVLFCMFNAGRAPLLAMALSVVVPIMLNKNIKHTWFYIMIIGIISLPLLDVLDQLYVYWQKGTFDLGEAKYLSYLSQFSYPINNVFHAFDIGNKFGYRFGQDFVTCILDILPGFTFEPSYIGTSEYMGGARWKVTGGTPNDIITLSILEFHVMGVVILPWVLGKISKFVDKFAQEYPDKRVGRVLSTVLAVNSFLMISNADPVAIFRAFILWIIPMIMILSISKIRTNRGQVYNEQNN